MQLFTLHTYVMIIYKTREEKLLINFGGFYTNRYNNTQKILFIVENLQILL